MSRRLSPETIEYIRHLWYSRPDLNAGEIGVLAGRSQFTVLSCVRRLGWKRRFQRTPDSLIERMRDLWENHPELPATRIAAILGCTANSVIGHADRRDWRRRGPLRSIPKSSMDSRLRALEDALSRVINRLDKKGAAYDVHS